MNDIPKLLPLNGHILVKVRKPEQKGSIILPDSSSDGEVRKVDVFALASDCKTPVSCLGKVGILNSYGGTEVNIDGEDYLLCSEKDLLAFLP